MAKKKSIPARQHQYVKQKPKFIDMSKEELIRLAIIVGAVIVAIVLTVVLIRAFDGSLAVKEGKVVTEGDNWIIGNTGTATAPRYYRLGTVDAADEYTVAPDMSFVSDENQPVYAYTPVTPDEAAPQLLVMAGSDAYDVLSERIYASFSSSLPNAQVSQMSAADVAGKHARTFSYAYNYDNTPVPDATATDEAVTDAAAQPAETNMVYSRGMYTYLEAGHGRSIVLSASASGADAESLPTEEVLQLALEKIAASITVG